MQQEFAQTRATPVVMAWMGLLVLLLSSCASYHFPAPKGQAPGDYLMDVINKEDVRNPSQIKRLVAQAADSPTLPKALRKALKTHPGEASQLFKGLLQGQDLETVITVASETTPDALEGLIYLSLRLYPVDSYGFVDELLLNDAIEESVIQRAALLAQMDPSVIFPPTAASAEPVVITPLIHSASISLLEFDKSTTAKVRFRPKGEALWTPALPLTFDPVRGALSGSLVRLSPNTDYEVTVVLSESDETIETLDLGFTTRKNTPDIDPDKIYLLKDIYQGGQLNLVKLGIEGAPGAWAKIVGDDDTVIRPESGQNSAIWIGNQSYILFEGVKVEGGRRYGIHSDQAHHLWFKDCEVSGFGRRAGLLKNGIGFEDAETSKPINYDAGFFLKKTGVVVIEGCDVHSPIPDANNWGYEHPKGASALLLLAKHPQEPFSGQYIIRNNRFYGSPEHRFNDVIESRANGRVWGGLVRDSAIHDNYLAYANDDIIEIDGGQSNVLIYNNIIEQGYVGISATPNMLGPNYIFNNYIHNLGDDRQRAWAAIKLGGLMSAPAGKTHLFDNLILSKGVGIAGSNYKGDDTFWADVRNNALVLSSFWQARGLGIYDLQKYPESQFINNYLFNTKTENPEYDARLTQEFHSPDLQNSEVAEQMVQAGPSQRLAIPSQFQVPNFSLLNGDAQLVLGVGFASPLLEETPPESVDKFVDDQD